MDYYIYRIKKEDYDNLNDIDKIKNELRDSELKKGSKVIIIVSNSLIVIGSYVYSKKDDTFIIEKKINKSVDEFYDKLPMVGFVNENTYKLFSKRVRRIDVEDYNVFVRDD